jgi:cytochrome c biogenesis protein ResB
MAEENKINDAEDIKKLLEQNLKYSKEIYRLTKKIKNHLTFQKVMSLIYFLLIVVPLILSIIYLPPLVKNYWNQYLGLLNLPAGSTNQLNDLLKSGASNLNNAAINQLPAPVRKLLNK